MLILVGITLVIVVAVIRVVGRKRRERERIITKYKILKFKENRYDY